MDLLAEPLVDALLTTISRPAVLAIAALVVAALTSGLVARSVEMLEDRVPVRVAAGIRSPGRGRPGPGA